MFGGRKILTGLTKVPSKADNKRAIEATAKTFRVKVHQYHDELIRAFSSQLVTENNSDFDVFVADPVIDSIENIAALETIEDHRKIAILVKIYNSTVDAIEQIQAVKLSTLLWRDRPNSTRSDDPCEFVRTYYPSFRKGLTQADIRSHDPPLYKALQNRKARKGWPEDFDLPTKSERNDQLLSKISTPLTRKGLSDAPPALRRKVDRLDKAARYRKQSS
ncbi:MAG: hypothetical protein ABJP66_18050 [Hyphomicrobiales bacterium]